LKSKTISIAGFNIRLQADDKEMLSLEEGYLSFISPRKFESADVVIKSYGGIPDNLLNTSDLLFEAKNDEQKFFSIHHQGEAYRFIIFDQQLHDKIQQVAILDKDLCEWKVYSDLTEKKELFPLLYPLGPIVLYYLTLKSEAIMMHASGIFEHNRGRLFTGFSGAGKSTMAYLWQKSGAKIINDDRLIIRKENGKYVMYNTPMFYIDVPKKAPLNSVYLIKHGQSNNLEKIKGAAAVSGLMAFCVQHNYKSEFIERQLAFLTELCNTIPVYDTGFLPDTSIVDFIKNNEH